MATANDLVKDALLELGVLNAADAPDAELATIGLNRLNRIVDLWNATREAIYEETFTNYTLTPSLSPHTIGPTGTFVVTVRPVSVEGANLVLNTVTPNNYQTITLRDRLWWLKQAVPALSTDIPTDLYYEPSWPNGKLYFWPVPSTAYAVQIMTRQILSTFTLATTFSLPPGYQDALTLTLAEALAAPLQVGVSPVTRELARKARATIQINNSETPGLATCDAGIPSGNGRRPTYNYRTGLGR